METQREYDSAARDGLDQYFADIAKTPLLNADQEVELAKRIEAGVYAQYKLDVASETAYDDQLRGELEWLAYDGDDAYKHMFQANLRLVVKFAKQKLPRIRTSSSLDMQDLIQAGNLGLDRAVKKFDYTKGFKFSTYARWWIDQSIVRTINCEGSNDSSARWCGRTARPAGSRYV